MPHAASKPRDLFRSEQPQEIVVDRQDHARDGRRAQQRQPDPDEEAAQAVLCDVERVDGEPARPAGDRAAGNPRDVALVSRNVLHPGAGRGREGNGKAMGVLSVCPSRC
eukprot:scaffold3486_cov118-Isochrysis_galbana.AAC.3